MARKHMTPLERLNDPNEILKLFAFMQPASLVGGILGTWIKSSASNEPFFEILPQYLLFGWVPVAIILAVVGILLFKRAERKTVKGQRD